MARLALRTCACVFTVRTADARHQKKDLDDWIAAGRPNNDRDGYITFGGPHEVAWTDDADPIFTISNKIGLATREGHGEVVRIFREWHDADPSRCLGAVTS